MSHNLFVYGTLKTGGPRWGSFLAPRVGSLAQVEGFRLLRVDGSPAMVSTGPGSTVYGELFRGVSTETLDAIGQAVDVHYRMIEVQLTTGTLAWTLVVSLVPATLVVSLVPGGRWCTRDISRGLHRLARERLVELGDSPSPQDRLAFAIGIREEIRPLAQANLISIPWRTGPNTPEWKLCRDYMDRLATAVEIGL